MDPAQRHHKARCAEEASLDASLDVSLSSNDVSSTSDDEDACSTVTNLSLMSESEVGSCHTCLYESLPLHIQSQACAIPPIQAAHHATPPGAGPTVGIRDGQVRNVPSSECGTVGGAADSAC